MGHIVHGVVKSRTWLSNFHFTMCDLILMLPKALSWPRLLWNRQDFWEEDKVVKKALFHGSVTKKAIRDSLVIAVVFPNSQKKSIFEIQTQQSKKTTPEIMTYFIFFITLFHMFLKYNGNHVNKQLFYCDRVILRVSEISFCFLKK